MLNHTLNAAVVGLGIGQKHLEALLMHPQVKLLGACDLDQSKMISILDKYQLSRSLSKNFSEILNDKNIHLVSIASFDDAHFDQVIACLRHEKHVFVEKPLCQTQSQLNEIYSKWKTTNLGIASNLILRKAPLWTWLTKSIQAGELGEIYAIDADYLYGRVHKITEGWRTKVNNYSVMAGGGIHMIDLMMRFAGQKPVQVQSHVNKIATHNTQFRYHDFHAATFYFENGLIARVTANFGCMHRHQHVVRVFGTKATFIYDDQGARIYNNRDEEAVAKQLLFSPKVTQKGELLVDFVNDILLDTHRKNTFSEFDLMCVVAATDQIILSKNGLIDIQYLENNSALSCKDKNDANLQRNSFRLPLDRSNR